MSEDERYYRQMMLSAKRTRFRREHGIRRQTRGRLESRREQKRRTYIRLKAEALGLDAATVERITPRRPQMARHEPRQRDALGRYASGAGSQRRPGTSGRIAPSSTAGNG
jgi:hypothetical protein